MPLRRHAALISMPRDYLRHYAFDDYASAAVVVACAVVIHGVAADALLFYADAAASALC